MTNYPPVISVRDLVVGFGEATVLNRASIDVFEGEILGFVGGSGAGKSVLCAQLSGCCRSGTERSRFSAATSPRSMDGNAARSSSAGACCSSRARCSHH
jgi:ABC-type transporter Mla maintaining outer membrane lipid asymmetry ATPase subunit MlaF